MYLPALRQSYLRRAPEIVIQRILVVCVFDTCALVSSFEDAFVNHCTLMKYTFCSRCWKKLFLFCGFWGCKRICRTWTVNRGNCNRNECCVISRSAKYVWRFWGIYWRLLSVFRQPFTPSSNYPHGFCCMHHLHQHSTLSRQATAHIMQCLSMNVLVN